MTTTTSFAIVVRTVDGRAVTGRAYTEADATRERTTVDVALDMTRKGLRSVSEAASFTLDTDEPGVTHYFNPDNITCVSLHTWGNE